MTFFSIIIFIILFFYLLQWAVRIVLRWKINRIQREMAKNGSNTYYKQYAWGKNPGRQQRTPKEGEIKVDLRTTPDKKINDRIGDYVEYEEVEIIEDEETR